MPEATATEILERLRESRRPAAARRERTKRSFDIAFGAFFLVAFSPVYLLLALLIRATSEGPVLYRSVRLGRGGKVIWCWKFRTMYTDADERLETLLNSDRSFRHEWDTYQKLRHDPRI